MLKLTKKHTLSVAFLLFMHACSMQQDNVTTDNMKLTLIGAEKKKIENIPYSLLQQTCFLKTACKWNYERRKIDISPLTKDFFESIVLPLLKFSHENIPFKNITFEEETSLSRIIDFDKIPSKEKRSILKNIGNFHIGSIEENEKRSNEDIKFENLLKYVGADKIVKEIKMQRQREEFKKLVNNHGTLDLLGKNIAYIYPGVFENLQNVKYLNLSKNNLIKLDLEIFKGLQELKYLILSNNNLTKLDCKAFNSLQKIEYLNLSHNELTKIDCEAFKGLHELKELDLSNNKLTKLDCKAFNGLQKIEYLNLSHNKLTKIDHEAFNSLQNLRTLNLSYNKLTKIDCEAFKGLHELKELDLSNNKLTKITPEALHLLHNLKDLYLSGNNIPLEDIEMLKKTFPHINNINIYLK